MNGELLPCPFCGCRMPADGGHEPDCYFTVLTQLKAAPEGDVSLAPAVLDAWNRRTAGASGPVGDPDVVASPSQEEVGDVRQAGEAADAAMLWLATVRDDFRRMADEANGHLKQMVSDLRSIDTSPTPVDKGGDVRRLPPLHALCGNCMTPHLCAEDGPGCVSSKEPK